MEDLAKKNVFFRPIVILFICSFIIYGFSLPFSLKGNPYFSPGNDFSNHANFMFHFAESFKAGQIIPRTLANPASFSDATAPTSSIPTFQYYGFFEGLAALPFTLVGLSNTMAAVLSSILIRFLGIVLLFQTCLLFGASNRSAFLATISFLISPYTLTVFYGRGALAESFAQSIFVLIPYGYALAQRNRFRHAVIAFAMAFFLLPLCHNIFFLYGMALLGLLAFFSFKPKIILAGLCGSTLGILMSAWQWLPSKITISDISTFAVLYSWKLGASVACFDVSSSGIFGIPQRYWPAGQIEPFGIYYTIGWWSLPFIFIVLAALFQKDKKTLAISFFITSLLFFIYTFQPFNIDTYQYLPQFFSILQDSSRLLGFVSLLSAICFAIAVPKINLKLFNVLIVLMLASQCSVFIFYLSHVSKQIWEDDRIRSAPINYYYSDPTDESFKTTDGTLSPENKFYIPPKKYQHFFLQLKGLTSINNKSSSLSVVALQEKPKPGEYKKAFIVAPTIPLDTNFSINIKVPATSPSGWYKILPSPNNRSRSLDPIALTEINVITDDPASWIFKGSLEEKKKSPYTYQYKVIKKLIGNFKPNKEGNFILALPHAYSRLFSVRQNGIPLAFSPDFNHRMLVKTKDIFHPIIVSYHWNEVSLFLTFLGFTGFLVVLIKKRNSLNAWGPSN